MYSVQSTRRYQKSLKRLIKSGRFHIVDVDVVINALREGKPLDASYQNHPLHGEYTECLECHIQSDLLLIYKINEKAHMLTIIDIGSHSELFG